MNRDIVFGIFLMIFVTLCLLIITAMNYAFDHEDGELYGDYMRRIIPKIITGIFAGLIVFRKEVRSIFIPTPKAKRKNEEE